MLSKVRVKDLKIGMFVADLDRPWIDTPFPLQGFLIDDGQQIAELQDRCRWVVIDRVRSLGEEYQAPVPNTGRPPGDGSAGHPVVSIGKVEPMPARGKRGFFDSLRDLLRGRPGGPQVADVLERAPEPPPITFQAPTKLFTDYPDVRLVEEEVLPAREAFERTSETLRNLTADLWAGKPAVFERVEEVVDEVVDSMVRNPDALMWVARLRESDMTTYEHGVLVGVYLVAFGRHLGFPRGDLAKLGTIGLLLDIGKMHLPRALLEKQGRLTAEEFEMVKGHVGMGLDILTDTHSWPAEVIEGIAQHHERLNGSGYPNALSGDDLGFYGRMAGIADCFTALTKVRPYAEAMSSYEALRSIVGWGGDYFHTPLTEQFVQAIGVFPPGSLVELSTGEVAVVVAHNKVRRLKPRVLLLTAPDKTPAAYPTMVDLLYDPPMGGEEPAYIRRSLPMGAYGLNPRDNYLS